MVIAEEMKPSVKVTVMTDRHYGIDGPLQKTENGQRIVHLYLMRQFIVSDFESSDKEDTVESEHDAESNSETSDKEDAVESEYDAEVSDASEQDRVDNESNSDNGLITNEGWADSIAKILGSSKPKNKKTLVLSRAKKFSEVKKEKDDKPTFEVIGVDIKEEKLEVKKEESASEPPIKKKKIDKPSIRVKPNILERDRERLLSKIATKGVVQLFNAVRNQQKTLEKEMDNNVSETKREKILKKFDKRTFLDSLMGNTKSIIVDSETKSMKDELKREEKPKWNALRDDFMMGAKMKDWDKESLDE